MAYPRLAPVKAAHGTQTIKSDTAVMLYRFFEKHFILQMPDILIVLRNGTVR